MIPRILIALLMLCGSAPSGAQPFAFIPYSISEGLPQSQVYAMLCDRHGHLWLGTQGGGVCRFDGLSFQTFTTADGLPSNYVQALYEDSRHCIWIGTRAGLVCFDGRSIVRPAAAANNLVVYCFWQQDPQTLWLGTSSGVYRYANNSLGPMTINPAIDRTPVYALFPTAGGLGIGTHRGGYFLRDGKLVNLTGRAGLPANPVYAFATAPNGLLALACAGEGLVLTDPNTLEIKEIKREPGLERTLCLFTAPDGSIWAGTQNEGIIVLPARDAVPIHLAEADGLPHNHVRALTADHAGNIWIGTSGGGLARAGQQAFRQYDRDDGLLGLRVYAVLEDRRGRIWFSTAQNGLQVLDPLVGTAVSRDSGALQGVKCKTIAEDGRGNMLAGSEGRGILVLDSLGRRHWLTRENGGIHANWIHKIVADGRGEIWVATVANGIGRLMPRDSGGWTLKTYGQREGLPEAAITTLRIDSQGNLWFGTLSGRVGYIRNGRVEAVFGADQGLPDAPVSSLAFDRAGNCWVATRGAGIFTAPARAGVVFQPIHPAQPLRSQNIYLLVVDRDGNMWAGNENGVDKLVLASGGAAKSAAAVKIEEVFHFGKNEGFLGIETCQDASWCDRAGHLWFGTMNGLIRYVPNDRKTVVVAPALHFEQIALFYKPLENTAFADFTDPVSGGLRPGLELPWNQNHLSFRFQGIDLVNPKLLRYRWKLEGADQRWTDFSSQNQVNYANLAPGEYRLLVQATSDDGVHLSAVIEAPFAVLPPVWRRWPFQAAVLVVLLGLTLAGVRMYVRRVRRFEALRREQLEMQNRLLQLEQKALQLQMNPHFIFNALNSIQSLIVTRDYETARQEINAFARLMRGILLNSRRQLIALREEIDTLEQYLRIERFCQQNAFTFALNVHDGLDTEEIELPPMLLQPFVENAVVHGISHLAYPGQILLDFALHGEVLVCTIRDNGIGREKAALLREAKKPGHQSVAMQVTRERLEALGGSLAITDLTDAAGQLEGTQVTIHIPVSIPY